MRRFLAMLVLGVVLATPHGWAADELDDEIDETDERVLRREITRDQIEALHDLEHAETDEEAEEAEERFNDASDREVQRRRAIVDDVIENGGSLPASPRPDPPHP